MKRTSGFQQGGVAGDLFRGAARFYSLYRRHYPPQVVSHIVNRCGLDGRGRLLDAGCGTGQVFCSFAKHFEEVLAIDSDGDMVAEATISAERNQLAHVIVRKRPAEEIGSESGTFRIAAFGASFHWMDRERVAEHIFERLDPDGWIVVLAPDGLHSGETEWEKAIREVIAKWIGPERRAGGGLYVAGERHEEILARSSFAAAHCENIVVSETWTIDEIVGWLYSTSYASHAVLREGAAGFEADLRDALARHSSSGSFSKDVEYTVIAAPRRRQ